MSGTIIGKIVSWLEAIRSWLCKILKCDGCSDEQGSNNKTTQQGGNLNVTGSSTRIKNITNNTTNHYHYNINTPRDKNALKGADSSYKTVKNNSVVNTKTLFFEEIKSDSSANNK